MRIDQQQARGRFRDARVARLATVGTGSHPHLVPVTFAVRGDELVTAVDHKPKSTPDLKRLRNIRAHPHVTLLVDHYDDDWSQLWWCRADGPAELREAAERDDLVAALTEKYPQYAEQRPTGTLIVVRVDRWTGWTGGS